MASGKDLARLAHGRRRIPVPDRSEPAAVLYQLGRGSKPGAQGAMARTRIAHDDGGVGMSAKSG